MIFVIQKLHRPNLIAMLYKLKDRRHKLYENYEKHNLYDNQYDICYIRFVRYIWKKTIHKDITDYIEYIRDI